MKMVPTYVSAAGGSFSTPEAALAAEDQIPKLIAHYRAELPKFTVGNKYGGEILTEALAQAYRNRMNEAITDYEARWATVLKERSEKPAPEISATRLRNQNTVLKQGILVMMPRFKAALTGDDLELVKRAEQVIEASLNDTIEPEPAPSVTLSKAQIDAVNEAISWFENTEVYTERDVATEPCDDCGADTGSECEEDCSRYWACRHAATLRAMRSGATAVPAKLPWNETVAKILGRPCFVLGAFAETLRLDGQVIPRKAEAEQAAVIYWMLNHYLAHGEGWSEIATAELNAIQERNRNLHLQTTRDAEGKLP
jgi:hypothetical protein